MPCNLCNSKRLLTYSAAFVWLSLVFWAEIASFVFFLLDFAIFCVFPIDEIHICVYITRFQNLLLLSINTIAKGCKQKFRICVKT